MYSGWISDRENIENECGEDSVLNNFPSIVGRDVAAAIIKNLMLQISEKKDLFKSEKDLEWTMDVICFGLTMPLHEAQHQHQVEIIKNCVYLYVDWTSVMSKKPKAGIPSQIILNKEFYFAKMLKHLANLFIPRESTSASFQEKFCKRVLFHLKSIVEEGTLSKSASENILKFYLGVCGHLLSAPLMHGLAELLCEQLINTLITVWIHICCQHFPSPTLWCTMRDMLLSWRHHHILILQWNKLMYVLTCKVLNILFGPTYPLPQLYRDDNTEPIVLPNGIPDDIAVQCWFRFLHSIGNPVDLTNTDKICNFSRYGHDYGRASAKTLPKSFFDAMQGVSVLVNMFLRSFPSEHRTSSNSQPFVRGDWKSASTGTMETHTAAMYGKPATVPGVRRIADQSLPTKTVRDDSNICPKTLHSISADANCILHLFGSWLFDVCLAGFHMDQVLDSVGIVSCGKKLRSMQLSKEEEEIGVKFLQVKKNEFEPGTAQSFSTLCRIFCHQRSAGQAILPVYLSRFYLTLAVGLCYGETRAGQVLGDILLNATDILRIDLHGVQVLVPHILQALEIILPSTAKDIILGYNISVVNLRRSCIQILLSMICLPLHFLHLPIQGLSKERVPLADCGQQVTFITLKGRLTMLLQKALEAERDSENTQLLLAGSMLLMEDTMLVELKNYEYSCTNPGQTTPCILLESIDNMGKGSPKLIHIAKPVPLKPSSVDTTKQQQKPLQKGEIGCLGDKNDPKTTKGLFVYITKFLCRRLMFADKGEEHSCWRGDLNITLAALECISGMSHFDSKFIDEDEAKSTLKWICDYIEYQAKKPPPSHSKDLHSIIVAAFNSIYSWLINHPWLLDHKGCLDAVLEVIELGISGTKSTKTKGKSETNKSETPTLKGDKELKTVSLRVGYAADALLALLMEHLGFFPNPCGPSSLTSLLDEESLFQNCSESSDKKFSYFAVDGSVILALLEDTINGAEKDVPSAVTIMRGPTGKRVCLIQLRQFARSKQDMIATYKQEADRPAPSEDVLEEPGISQQHFPVEVDRVTKTKSDMSIPGIDDITDNQRNHQNNMETMMKFQREQEEISVTERQKNTCALEDQGNDDFQKQPPIASKLRATRLFLSHLGLLKIENLQSTAPQYPGLISLDASNDGLWKRLQALDAFPIRTYDTMLIFFVKKGQYSAKDISSNEIPSLDNQLFMEFLHSLGWPVNLSNHTGWNGDVTTSWRLKSRLTETHQSQTKRMFYYADLMTELAIHIPALNLKQAKIIEEPSIPPTTSNTEATSPGISAEIESKVAPLQQVENPDVSDGRRGRKLRKQETVDHPTVLDIKHKINNSQSETKVVVAWLQDFNDHETFPALDLVELCDPQEYSYSSGNTAAGRVPDKEVVVIYIHPLKTGLFRIMVATVFGSSVGGPLVEGMVCSRRVLGSMVRKTAINVCRRRRLEIDSYAPPHVCRKIRIQDIVRKYSVSSKIPEFYASLMED